MCHRSIVYDKAFSRINLNRKKKSVYSNSDSQIPSEDKFIKQVPT